MNLIRLCIRRPIAVLAAVMIVIIMGLVSLQAIPIQLTPDVRKPLIEIDTRWYSAAPREVEREIIERQEEQLSSVEGIEEMKSTAQSGRGQVELTFRVDQNMDRALLLVANRLDQVEGYPDEADEPRLNTAGSDDNAITWMILRRNPGNTRDMHEYLDFAKNVIQDRLERVKGIARINVFGGGERELQVVVDPERMARFGLTVTQIKNELRAANATVSAGDVDEGKRRYVVRTEGELNTLDHVREVVLRTVRDTATGQVARVTVNDIATVKFGYKDPRFRIRLLGEQAIAINATRETGANVMDAMQGIRKAIGDLNKHELPAAGLNLWQVYDETVYITSSIDLVQQNIFVGGALAALILLLFLRSIGATLVVSFAIPISIIGSFVAMTALGRSINVISLAGLAFAVGMVVDAAIVVLENIFRLRQEGRSRFDAAYEGAKQVWGAILVSSLTTVVVFIPILVMPLEVGQLFRDIAVAISVAVLLSLIVAVTVIPSLACKLLGKPKPESSVFSRIPVIDPAASRFVEIILAITRRVVASRSLSIFVVVCICSLTALGTYLFLPKLDYLPEGNRNLVFGLIKPPPGYNLKTMTEIATRMENEISHLWTVKTGPESKPGEPPKMQRFFFVASPNRTFIGGSAEDPSRVKELIPVLQEAANREPGSFGIVRQLSLFGRGIGGARKIELHISSPKLEDNFEVARETVRLIEQVMPRRLGTQINPKPGLEMGSPEIRIYPNRIRLSESGVTARELADTIDAFNDGLRVSEISVDNKIMDLMLKGPAQNVATTQGINQLPVVTKDGTIVPAASLSKVDVTSGPVQIQRLERTRTVTIDVSPPETMPLEQAIELLQQNVVTPLEKTMLKPGMRIRISGSADQLAQTWNYMVWDLLLAVVIVYLVMAILLESFIYPFIIMLSVPLATAGGVAGLVVLNLYKFHALDMLTLLGFVILIGIVVNNAILLVHQTLYQIREHGLAVTDAIYESTRNRIRPIFMSTLTSIFGMMPLVLFPGAGSELYRGLGSVVLGGLAFSAVLTLAIIPPLLGLVTGFAENRRHRSDQTAKLSAE
ncbi:MAG: efflux RND transporter permease subunit [Rhodospirillaceae bacterium]|jgi:HAE1 family hydrophobic/amphiphilic exporter-1